MIDLDVTNQRKWTERIERIKSDKNKYAEEKKEWEQLSKEINSALFEERWKDVVSLGKRALAIHEDETLQRNINRAEQKLASMKAEEKYAKTMDQVKARMQDKNWDEARRLLGGLKIEYPEHDKDITALFKRIFAANF